MLILIFMDLMPFKFLVWNCRGAGNRSFLRHLKDLLATHRPQIFALLEPRVSGSVADHVCRSIGWENWYRVEADGFSGGIWIFWRDDNVAVKVVHDHHQFVHLQLSTRVGWMWFLTIVYASPNRLIRSVLWEDLRRIATKQPWCIIGDFNSVLYPHERSPVGYSSASFLEWANEEGMVDLGFKGPMFT